MPGKIGVAQLGRPFAWKTVTHRKNDPASLLSPLEEAVPIGKQAVARAHFHAHAPMHIPSHHTMEVVALLHSIRADILNWGSATGAWNEGEVFQPMPSALYTLRNEAMPGLASLGFDQQRAGVVIHQRNTTRGHMHDQFFYPGGQHDIAASPQYYDARVARRRVGKVVQILS